MPIMGGPADIHILRNMYTKSCILTVFFFIILPRTHTANLHAHKNRKDYLSKLLTGYTPAHTHTYLHTQMDRFFMCTPKEQCGGPVRQNLPKVTVLYL